MVQVRSTESDNNGDEHASSFAEVCVKAVEVIEVQEHQDESDGPEVFPRMETFPQHILFHLSTYSGKNKLYTKAKKIPAIQWSEKQRARLDMNYVTSCFLLTA